MSGSNGYYVITRSGGEISGTEWNVTFYPGADPESALERAMADGYFEEGKPAIVVHEDDAHLFTMLKKEELVAGVAPSRAEVVA